MEVIMSSDPVCVLLLLLLLLDANQPMVVAAKQSHSTQCQKTRRRGQVVSTGGRTRREEIEDMITSIISPRAVAECPN